MAAIVAVTAVAVAALLSMERSDRGPAARPDPALAEVPAPRAPTSGAPVSAPRAPTPRAEAAPPGPGIIVRPGPPPVAVDVRARVQEQATAAMARVREVVLATCKPQVDELSHPVAFTVHLGFDRSGQEVGRSATHDGPLPAGLEACLLVAEAGALRVDAPGVPLSTKVQVELP